MIHHNADIWLKDTPYKSGRNALHIAIHYGQLECAEALLKSSHSKDYLEETTNYDDDTALSIAVEQHKPRCVELLLKYGSQVNRTDKHGWTPLSCFVRNFLTVQLHLQDDCIKHLLRAGASILDAEPQLDDTKGSFTLQRYAPSTYEILIGAGCFMHVYEKGDLLSLSQLAIKKQLLDVHPSSNLFCLVPDLPLPAFMKTLLLNNVQLD